MKNLKIFLGYLTLMLIALSMLYPFFAMVNLSFTENNEIFSHAGRIFHNNLTFENYKNVFTEIPIGLYFFNSLLVALVTTIGQVIFSSLAGYFRRSLTTSPICFNSSRRSVSFFACFSFVVK